MPGVKGEVSVIEPSKAEAALARRHAEARATVPDVELTAEVDVSAAQAVGFSHVSLLVRACALALRAIPRANAAYRDGRYELYSRVNVGIALTGQEPPAIPTIFDADQKSPQDIEAELKSLRSRANVGELTAAELGGATFTLYDMSELGVLSATPMLVPPQAGALAAGSVRLLPRILERGILPAPMMTITLAADGRILHGAHAARFLTAVRANFEETEL